VRAHEVGRRTRSEVMVESTVRDALNRARGDMH
jgi:hypothetical protein